MSGAHSCRQTAAGRFAASPARAAILLRMPEPLPPPPGMGEQEAEPDWYPDPHALGVLRWWDGDAWSDTDVKPAGEDGYPRWHPEFLRERVESGLEELAVRIAARIWRG